MTREEVKKIVFIIHGTYPGSFKNMEADRVSLQVDVWLSIFKDYQYADVEVALKTYLITDTKGFPPTPGQVIDKLFITSDFAALNEMEAWGCVYKAICNANYHSDEEFVELPQIVQKAVGNPARLREWAQLPTDEVQTVIQSNFMRSYRVELSRAKEYEKMPEEIRMMIAENSRKELTDGN